LPLRQKMPDVEAAFEARRKMVAALVKHLSAANDRYDRAFNGGSAEKSSGAETYQCCRWDCRRAGWPHAASGSNRISQTTR
jgi:hypothetical protein